MAGEQVLVIDDSPTITKVVQLVLTKAGFTVRTAPDGEAGLAAARASRPAVILLDFVMPKMNGYQFCKAQSADAELRDIPVVLMSARGDQVGERFVKVMGIVDYITKPFSPEAITAVVQHTIAKYTARTEVASRSLVTGEDLAATDDADRLAARSTALAQLRSAIAGAVAAAPSAAEALDDATLLRALGSVDLELMADARPGLRGDLRVVPLAEVLQLLQLQEQSGVLTVERAAARVDMYFRHGRVDQAMARGVPDEFLLGRFVVDGELMQRAELDAVLETRPAQPKLLGQQLVKLGHISAPDLRSSLIRQSSELVYELLRWRHGSFRFTAGAEPPPSVIDAALGLDVEAVLMEGYRRVDEWHLIERAIDDFDIVFLRNEDQVSQMGRGRLTREELAVLELVNGKHTVQEIIRKSRMGSFEVSKMLYRLLSLKLVRRRAQPVAV
jgi:DNA-binding response OmpR family regulator